MRNLEQFLPQDSPKGKIMVLHEDSTLLRPTHYSFSGQQDSTIIIIL